MRLTLKAFTGALALMAVLAAGSASATDALSPAQRKATEELVRDYILNNPDVIIQSLRDYEEKQRQTAEKEAEQAIAANRQALERDASSPVAGNPNGDVTIVEFFDYRCGFCKKVLPSVRELLKTDGKVRWVFKEFPILGPDSGTASQFALAAWRTAPEKYLPFHMALMEHRGDLGETQIMEIAKKVGLDVESLKKARTDPEIKSTIERNMDLAHTLEVNGTPAFVVGGHLVPGAVDLATLRQLVEEARKG